MLRLILLFLLIVFLGRAIWRLIEGVAHGALGTEPGARGGKREGPRAVSMARDPVCGVYVVPEKAVSLTRGGQEIFFCSDACRAKFRG